MRTLDDLYDTLLDLDGAGYGGYKRIRGAWTADWVTLGVDHVQGDPFATPSAVHVRVPLAEHQLPRDLWDTRTRRIALQDVVLRAFARAVRDGAGAGRSGSGRSGDIQIDVGDAEVLERAACVLRAAPGTPEEADDRTDSSGSGDGDLVLRFRVGLPARGRRVLGRAAAELLTATIPAAVECVLADALDLDAARAFVDLVDDHAYLQRRLSDHGLVAFLVDGAVLPRATGVSSQPLAAAVPLVAPDALAVELTTQHHGTLRGLGIRDGVTLITGGGFHGKTTLLEAIQRGVYPHIPGDGREWVVTRADAVHVRSEDGRAVTGVDLRPFVRELPSVPPRGATTAGPAPVPRSTPAAFTTQDASGSTSLAASILEAIEVGCRALLLDEDTCATNLLTRDARMQALVRTEPLVPLLDHVRRLHLDHGISTVLVLGANGDYLDVADQVLLMDAYRVRDVTEQARAVVRDQPTARVATRDLPPLPIPMRLLDPACLQDDSGGSRGGGDGDSPDQGRGRESRGRPRGRKIRGRGTRALSFGRDDIDLAALSQLVDASQTHAIGAILDHLGRVFGKPLPLAAAVGSLPMLSGREHDPAGGAPGEVEPDALHQLGNRPELAMPRGFELAAAINRLRTLAAKPTTGER